jgi:hypothetical protein
MHKVFLWVVLPWAIILGVGIWAILGAPGLSALRGLLPGPHLNANVADAVDQARDAERRARAAANAAQGIADDARSAANQAKQAMAAAQRGAPGYGEYCSLMSLPGDPQCSGVVTSASCAALCRASSAIYYGQIVNGKREGFGIFQCYRGQWHDNQQSGLGVDAAFCDMRGRSDGIGDPDGTIGYAGQWTSGRQNGLGVIANAEYGYAGGYKAGEPDGYGVRYSRSPEHDYDYEEAGQFSANSVAGFAVRTRTGRQQQREEGRFSDNLQNGFGARFGLNGDLIEEGVYENDRLRTALQ